MLTDYRHSMNDYELPREEENGLGECRQWYFCNPRKIDQMLMNGTFAYEQHAQSTRLRLFGNT